MSLGSPISESLVSGRVSRRIAIYRPILIADESFADDTPDVETDQEDYDYDPAVKNTPKGNNLRDRDRDFAIRVFHASGKSKDCRFTRQKFVPFAVQAMHALRRSLSTEEIRRLEFYFGYLPGTLNLDKRLNGAFSDSVFHALYDGGYLVIYVENDTLDVFVDNLLSVERRWIYFEREPVRPDLEAMIKSIRELLFQSIPKPAQGWPYYVLPTAKMVEDEVTVRRLIQQFPDGIHSFEFPYSSWGPVYSHVHPLFFIADAVTKVLDPVSCWSDEQERAAETLLSLNFLFTLPFSQTSFDIFLKTLVKGSPRGDA